MENKSKRGPTFAVPRRFSLRSLIIVMTLICIVVSIGALKVRQDRDKSHAMSALRHVGFQQTIGSANGRGATWLRYTRPEFANRDLELSLKSMNAIQKRHDLGISNGLEIKLVDFSNCRVSENAIAEFQAQFPDAEIRR
jgi:hypothetical protein